MALPIYKKTQREIGYGDIWLRREGDYAVVEIEHKGQTVEVIRELYDSNFCHCISSLGIKEEIERQVR